MSNDPSAEPTPPSPDAQPTQAYPDAPPTQAYRQPEGGNGQAYPQPYAQTAPPSPPYGAPPAYGQPTQAYGQPAQQYGQPAYAQPTGPDTRPKTIAWTALILAVVGTILSIVGLTPIPWVGLIAVILGGLALVAGLIFAIVGLAGKRHGGKPLSIVALVLSVIGAVIGMVALVLAIIFTSTAGLSAAVSDAASDTTFSQDVSAADQTAYIAEVRPKFVEAMMAVDPSLTADVINLAFPDEALIAFGQATLFAGEAGFNIVIDQAITAVGGTGDAAAMHGLYDAVHSAAEQYLQ